MVTIFQQANHECHCLQLSSLLSRHEYLHEKSSFFIVLLLIKILFQRFKSCSCCLLAPCAFPFACQTIPVSPNKLPAYILRWFQNIIPRAISIPSPYLPPSMWIVSQVHYRTYHVLLQYIHITFCGFLRVFDNFLQLLGLMF